MIIEALTSSRPATSVARAGARRSRHWLLPLACAFYLACITAFWFITRQYGDRQWIATLLLLGPRWPFALPLLALWPWTLVARRWRPATLTTIATLIVLVPILGLRLSLPAAAERADLRLLTCNVHRQQLKPESLATFIAEVQPDVVALQGWSEANYERVFAGRTWNARREGELLVASRFPIQRVTSLDLSDGTSIPAGERGAAGLFEIAAPSGTVTLLCLHLASPHAGLGVVSSDGGDKLSGNLDRRCYESELVRAACQSVQGPLLLAGDFNTTDDSPIFHEHWHDFGDAFSQRGNGFGYTYLIRHTQLRIDHVLARPTAEFVRCWVGPDVGSPHRPLVADVKYRSAASGPATAGVTPSVQP